MKRYSRKLYSTLATLLLLIAGGAAAAPAAAADWTTDSAHTEIEFQVNHFFTPVRGHFGDYTIDLDYNPGTPEKSSVEATIRVASIDTGNDKRDGHLRTADFFDADKYPEMTFRSTSVRKAGEDRLVATGPLTIKGKSKEIELSIELLGQKKIPKEMQPMLGGTKEVASFRATTTIDRGDFEVGTGSWAATLVVGSDVEIEIRLEAHRK